MTNSSATTNCSFCCGTGCDRCASINIADVPTQSRVSSNTTLLGTDSYGYTVQQIGNFLILGSASISWGEITGTLSDQIDLQNRLNLKANLNGAALTTASVNGTVLQSTGGGTKFLADDGGYYTGTSSVAWGAVSGTLSDQADLQAALDTKEEFAVFVNKSIDYTIVADKEYIIITAIGADVTIDLPTLSQYGDYIFSLSMDSTHSGIIDAAPASSTINGLPDFALVVPGSSVSIRSGTVEYVKV